MAHLPSRLALTAALLTLTTALFTLTATAVWAAEAPCDAARRLVGEPDGMSDQECLRVVAAAEEERWQLWLDMAMAHEHSGDDTAAIAYYERFLDAATGDPLPLSSSWAKVREDAAAAVARLDARLRDTHGRLAVTTSPSDAKASFEGKAASIPTHTTPFVAYLAPGPHNLQLYHPAVGDTRDIAFDISAGQALSLDVDLRADTSTPGPSKAVARAPAGDGVGEVATPSLTDIGWLGVAAGAGAIAVGTALYVVGDGELSATECTTEPWCQPTAAERARRRDDAEGLRDGGVAAWVVGGLLLAGGITAIALDDQGDDGATTAADLELRGVAPLVLRDGAGVGATLSF